MNSIFPSRDTTRIHFAHIAYQFDNCFAKRNLDIKFFQSRTAADTAAQIRHSEVLVATGFWRNELLDQAENLRFIQVAGAGYDAFDLDALRARGIRLANSSGVNKNAVSEHAMGLILSFSRRLHEARDNQQQRFWRGMMSDFNQREDELPGKTLLIYGLGAIGDRLAKLARAFDMHVVGIKRNTDVSTSAHEVYTPDAFTRWLPQADFVALTCPLTDATRNLMNAETFALMRPDAYFINVARGGRVDEASLEAALANHQIKGAGIDTTVTEPLAAESNLWALPNAIITPHTGGETCLYEENVIDFLVENLNRLWAGQTELVNQVI